MENKFYLNEINDLALTDKELLISMSEKMYKSQIETLVDTALKNNNLKIFLIAGPSSSGKTTTSYLVSKELEKHGKKSIAVSLDDFFLNRDKTPLLPNGNYDYENITALDLEYFNKFISDIYTNKKAYMPKYNFINGEREKEYTEITVDDNTYLVIEGLHALNPNLLNVSNDTLYKIYICALSDFYENDQIKIDHVSLRLMRRFIRDFYTRGRSIESTLGSWDEVMDGERKYIDPYKNSADFFVDSTHMYEPNMYAKYLKPILDKCSYEKAQQVSKMLENLEHIDIKLMPSDSLLNEFVHEN